MLLFTLPGKPCPYHHSLLIAHFDRSLCFSESFLSLLAVLSWEQIWERCLNSTFSRAAPGWAGQGHSPDEFALWKQAYAQQTSFIFLTALLAEVLNWSSCLRPLTSSKLFSLNVHLTKLRERCKHAEPSSASPSPRKKASVGITPQKREEGTSCLALWSPACSLSDTYLIFLLVL